MNVVMGATGHVGAAVVRALLERGEPVIAVTHDAAKTRRAAAAAGAAGIEIVEADVDDPASLRAVYRSGRRAFVLNPPAITHSCNADQP